MTDIKELRRLAEAATQGEWKSMYTARRSNPSEKDKFYSVSALSPAIPGWCGAQNIDIATICKIYDGTDASNSEFIAAANPSAILSLLDKIDAQEALIAELHTSIAGAVQHGEQGWQRYEAANKMCLNQQNEIVSLNEVIAELRKDAERYRWLRKTGCDSWMHELHGWKVYPPNMIVQTKLHGRGIELDTAIDAALLADTSTQEVG